MISRSSTNSGSASSAHNNDNNDSRMFLRQSDRQRSLPMSIGDASSNNLGNHRISPSFANNNNGFPNNNDMAKRALNVAKGTNNNDNNNNMHKRKRSFDDIINSNKNDSNNNNDLMQRLNAMSGGFPMPKWARNKEANNNNNEMKRKRLSLQEMVSERQRLQVERVNNMRGAFPLPPKQNEANNNKTLSLDNFRRAWYQTPLEYRKEIFSLRLEKGNLINTRKEENDGAR